MPHLEGLIPRNDVDNAVNVGDGEFRDSIDVLNPQPPHVPRVDTDMAVMAQSYHHSQPVRKEEEEEECGDVG